LTREHYSDNGSGAVKLTVGIPTYNRARLLGESIESVLAQSFTSFRLVVSDNASDDDTPEVVRSFNDDRIQYVRSDQNAGAIANLNHLIELADTEFLVLLPDDDVLYPGHLGAIVGLLERSESIGLAHSGFDLIDAGSRVLRQVKPWTSRAPVTIAKRDLALEQLMTSPWGLCFSSVGYRTRAIRAAGGFRAEEEPFGDRQLWMRLALDWDFGYIARPLVGFRMHAATVTTSVAARHGVPADGRQRGLLYSQINFQRRMDFLEHAPLDPSAAKRLRALAELQLLVEGANSGLPGREVAARFASLVRAHPGIARRPAVWRLVVAQLGARRARSAFRAAAARHAAS
jgi:glycosyltransferase involved in cell wall biosynthesis